MLRKFKINIDGVSYLVEMEELTVENQETLSESISPRVSAEDSQPEKIFSEEKQTNQEIAGGTPIYAPMPGKILKLLAKTGDRIIENQPLLILEAMKMENQIVANKAGKIIKIHALEGQNVDSGALLLEIS